MGRLLHPGKGAGSGPRGVQFTGLLLQPAAEYVHSGHLGATAAAEGSCFGWKSTRLDVCRIFYDRRDAIVRPFYGDTESKADSAKFCLAWAGAFARPPVGPNQSQLPRWKFCLYGTQHHLMNKKLLELQASVLLDKIGSGKHIPGSGSAAALNGIVAAKLLITVLQATLRPKRERGYGHVWEKCKSIKEEVDNDLIPELEYLFQEDSDQFDRAINKRLERDKQENQKKKNIHDRESLKELTKSTVLPIQIAKISLKLAEYSIFAFTECYKTVRGDSSVALHSALASVSGCIAIITLNLQSFIGSSWTDDIKRERQYIQNELQRLTDLSFRHMKVFEEETDRKNEMRKAIREIQNRHKSKLILSKDDISELARDLQVVMWKYQDLIYKDNESRNILDVIQPSRAIRMFKYDYKEVETLGDDAEAATIGGVIDNSTDTISIAKMYPEDVRRFTAAHELGHALMHQGLIMHRDIPRDAPVEHENRAIEEVQSDQFAAYFLMPAKTVTELFKRLFQVNYLARNAFTAEKLGFMSYREFQLRYKTVRELSREVAKTKYFNLQPFQPIHKIFGVSIEAMAIRLEELGLVRE